MRLSEIEEARKNPEQNPKVSINQAIINKIKKENSEVFVTFTDIDKLGVNPNISDSHMTPLGIYAYPARYVIQHVGKTGSMKKIPYAGNREYASIFTYDDPGVLDLSKLDEADLPGWYQKLTQAGVKLSGIQNGTEEWKAFVDEVESVIMYAPRQAKINNPAGRLWHVATEIAAMLTPGQSPASKRDRHDYADPSRSMWNKLFRTAGISGAIDRGSAVIHTNEPTQAVFFSTQPITNVERALNKYSPDDMDSFVDAGELTNEPQQQPPEEQEQQ